MPPAGNGPGPTQVTLLRRRAPQGPGGLPWNFRWDARTLEGSKTSGISRRCRHHSPMELHCPGPLQARALAPVGAVGGPPDPGGANPAFEPPRQRGLGCLRAAMDRRSRLQDTAGRGGTGGGAPPFSAAPPAAPASLPGWKRRPLGLHRCRREILRVFLVSSFQSLVSGRPRRGLGRFPVTLARRPGSWAAWRLKTFVGPRHWHPGAGGRMLLQATQGPNPGAPPVAPRGPRAFGPAGRREAAPTPARRHDPFSGGCEERPFRPPVSGL